jgi:hypothetical protein
VWGACMSQIPQDSACVLQRSDSKRTTHCGGAGSYRSDRSSYAIGTSDPPRLMSFGTQLVSDNFRLAPPTLGIPTSPRRRPESASPRLPSGRASPCNLAETWHRPFATWEQQVQRSARGATRPRSAAVSGRVASPRVSQSQGQPAYPKPKPRPATAFVTDDRGHVLPGSRKSPQEPGSPRTVYRPSTARNVFSPRETYPWRTSLPLPSSLDWGESTPRGMRFEKTRAPTSYRPQSAGASRWPDAAHFATGYTQAPATTAGCQQAAGRPSSAAARDLAAVIRPASVARCISAR